ncbi:p24 complex component [Entomortierella beljakovae]|nr:p24 complex component [Entomortierella beljakovae]
MIQKLAILFIAFVALLHTVSAFGINVAAGEDRCFHEDVETGDNIHISFQVGDGGNLDIDFWITDPRGTIVEEARKVDTELFNHEVKMAGKYTYCFSNEFSHVTEKAVTFNIFVMKPYQPEDPSAPSKTDPLEIEIRELANGIEEIRNEQEYTLARERTHRNTAESTNSRVVWWSLFQSAILFLVCIFQVTYLKRFFEVKRGI